MTIRKWKDDMKAIEQIYTCFMTSSISPEVYVAWEDARAPAANDVEAAQRPYFTASGFWKNVPESQSFISSTCYDRATVWVHGQVEHSECVPRQRCYLFHGRVLPHYDLVE